MWPFAAGWLADEESPLLALLVGLALSLGVLYVGLYLPALIIPGWITPLTTALIVFGGLAGGLALNPAFLRPHRWITYGRRLGEYVTASLWRVLLVGSVAAVGIVILAFDLYYPFIGDDTLWRYGFHAQQIYTTGTIPDSVIGYPPGAPLSFVATWFAVGAPNEHLARLYPFVMAMGTLGATYLLGREVLNRQMGLLAASLVTWCPLFVANALIAYIDIPVTFPLTLVVLFAVRWYRTQQRRDALLAGVMFAIALLIKQSALLWAVSMAAVVLVWMVTHRRAAWSAFGLMLLPAFLIAGPWYVRNQIMTRTALPIAGQFHLLEPNVGLMGAVPPLADPAAFGLPLAVILSAGWLFGLGWAVKQGLALLTSRLDQRPDGLLLMAFVVPYWLAWWTTFSFDVRFLLQMLPLQAVITVAALQVFAIKPRLPAWVAVPIVAGLTLIGAEPGLGGVYWWLRAPQATSAERFARARPTEGAIVAYVHQHLDPETDRIMVMDGRLVFLLAGYEVRVTYPVNLPALEGYDYVITSSSYPAVYKRLNFDDGTFIRYIDDPRYFEDVFVIEGDAAIKRVLQTEEDTP